MKQRLLILGLLLSFSSFGQSVQSAVKETVNTSLTLEQPPSIDIQKGQIKNEHRMDVKRIERPISPQKKEVKSTKNKESGKQ